MKLDRNWTYAVFLSLVPNRTEEVTLYKYRVITVIIISDENQINYIYT